MLSYAVFLALAWTLGARAEAPAPAPAPSEFAADTFAEPGSVGGPHPEASGLPFIEDDLPRAIAEAKASKLPIFVDAWAPW